MQHEGVTTRPHSLIVTLFWILGTAVLCNLVGAASARPAEGAVAIHGPDEVLAGWTVTQEGHLYFRAPGGRLWELVTDIQDPVILNQGQGSFFPVNPADVEAEVAAIPVAGRLDADVFILPYPRRDLLPSNAEGSSIFLSPGVAPMNASQVAALVAHELGHVYHRTFLPDADTGGWSAYRQLRGIADGSVYNATAQHRNRPHEIFAEDFRYLFGGSPANYSGGIENPDLALPDAVPGLETFLKELSDPARGRRRYASGPLVLYPNPTPAGATLELAGPTGDTGVAMLSVVDVAGRLVARRELAGDAGMRWDGRVDGGGQAPPGLYFLRVTRGAALWTGKLLVRR